MHIVSLGGGIAPESGGKLAFLDIPRRCVGRNDAERYAKTSSIVWKLDVGKKAKDMWGELS